MSVCNPLMQTNPFEAWQKLWLQGLGGMQQPAKLTAPAPADMFGQMNTQLQAMQNMWLSAFNPQPSQPLANPFMPFMPSAMPAPQMPKITVTTIELGDMRPYMEMATSMMQAFAPMMQQWGRK